MCTLERERTRERTTTTLLFDKEYEEEENVAFTSRVAQKLLSRRAQTFGR